MLNAHFSHSSTSLYPCFESFAGPGFGNFLPVAILEISGREARTYDCPIAYRVDGQYCPDYMHLCHARLAAQNTARDRGSSLFRCRERRIRRPLPTMPKCYPSVCDIAPYVDLDGQEGLRWNYIPLHHLINATILGNGIAT